MYAKCNKQILSRRIMIGIGSFVAIYRMQFSSSNCILYYHKQIILMCATTQKWLMASGNAQQLLIRYAIAMQVFHSQVLFTDKARSPFFLKIVCFQSEILSCYPPISSVKSYFPACSSVFSKQLTILFHRQHQRSSNWIRPLPFPIHPANHHF